MDLNWDSSFAEHKASRQDVTDSSLTFQDKSISINELHHYKKYKIENKNTFALTFNVVNFKVCFFTLVKAIPKSAVHNLGQLAIAKCCIFQDGILTKALAETFFEPRISSNLSLSDVFVNCSTMESLKAV